LATSGGIYTEQYDSRSNLLSTHRDRAAAGNWDVDPTCTFFTCADALRGLKTVELQDPYYNDGLPFTSYVVPAIYTNMQDFAKDLLTDLCGGIGIERNDIGSDVLVAESIYYFFDDDDDIIADLGSNIANFEMKDFNDFRGSSISIGQPDQQFDAINGPLETMSEVEYNTGVTRINKSVNLLTPYTAAPYQLELLRANIGNKTNVNSSSDNDTCKIQVASADTEELTTLHAWNGLSGYEDTTVNALKLLRPTTISAGLPAELLTDAVNPYAMYNLSFSIGRKSKRLLPWLCSLYRGLPEQLMSLVSAKKNIKVVSLFAFSDVVTESDFINVSEDAITYTPPFSTNEVTVEPAPIIEGRETALIFKPYIFSFTGPAIKNLPLLMTPPGTILGGKMYRKIAFTFIRNGISYPLAGFVMEVGITPGDNATCNYVLLCGPRVEIPDTL